MTYDYGEFIRERFAAKALVDSGAHMGLIGSMPG